MVSIIIAYYKVKKELFACIQSIYDSKPKTELEIIVVDNDEIKTIGKDLKKKFPKVRYVESPGNLGYGGGNNLGAKNARGEYLFFLNPDTRLEKDTINSLYNFLSSGRQLGIVSPLILNENKEVFNLQGYGELTPLRAITSFTFLKRIFFNHTIFNNYSLKDWNKHPVREVDTCYGAALMIPAKIFKQIKGFDENLFLYFEENDISRRVRDLGFKVVIYSNSRLIHKVGQSTKRLENKNKIFSQSRFIYLNKYYGYMTALLVELLIDGILKINKTTLFLAIVLLTAIFLRIYNLSQSMPFIGDQGWFYLSARDLIVNGTIPLVGITSSHTWLHQGPLWTYMLAVVLYLFKFNPVSGAYLTVFFGALTVLALYKCGSIMFNKRIGVVSASLYAVSPLAILFDRTPFDPSPIPFFTVLYLFSIYKWLKGNTNYFPYILFLIAVLYNLELATFTLFFPFALIFIYGLYRNQPYVGNLKNVKIFVYSLIALFVPMLPVIIYDFSNGFKQTIVFLGWTLYKPFSFLINSGHSSLLSSLNVIVSFLFINTQKLIFEASGIIALIIIVFSLVVLAHKVSKSKHHIANSMFLLLLFLLASLAGILLNQTPSGAYLPITFPFIIFTVAIMFEYLFSFKKINYLVFILFMVVLCSNFYFSYRNSFTVDLQNRMSAVEKIIALTNGQEYNLIGKGPGSQFESFTMNYEYLLWWRGHPVSNGNTKLKIVIFESGRGIMVSKRL